MLPAVGHPAWMLLGGHFLPLVGCGFLLRSPCAHPLRGWDGKRLAGELKMLCRLRVGPCEWLWDGRLVRRSCSLFLLPAIWWTVYRWFCLPRLLSVPPLLSPPEPGTSPSAFLLVFLPSTVPDLCVSHASSGLTPSFQGLQIKTQRG